MPDSNVQLLRRGLWTLRTRGLPTLAGKAAKTVHERLSGGLPDLAIGPDLIADSRSLNLEVPHRRPDPSQKLTVGWVCTPPALGSGGHTTMFRMIRALEAAGHDCRIYLYDRHGGDLDEQRRAVRLGWPEVQAKVSDVGSLPARSSTTSADLLDACVATSWESAHVMATLGTAPMRRLYFVQDFEPYFHPRGSEYALAEDSYRFGFRCIALGKMVGDCLTKEIGISPDVTSFGCDTAVYNVGPNEATSRNGIVCYARPGAPRRGFWLAKLALIEFHRRHPEVPIHVYGGAMQGLGFDVEEYPRLLPSELNQLYNRSIAGLALSFTNISLVAEEMLAAGVIPVVNESYNSRADLDNPNVAWAFPTAAGIADALSAVVSSPRQRQWSADAAKSVRPGWSQTQDEVVGIIENEVYG